MDVDTTRHLESEVQKIWERLVALENRKPEYEELKASADTLSALLETDPARLLGDITNASKKCAEYRNRIRERKEECEKILDALTKRDGILQDTLGQAQEELQGLKAEHEVIAQKGTQVADEYNRFVDAVDSWNEKINTLEEACEKSQSNVEEAERIRSEVETIANDSDSFHNKITVLHGKIVEERNKIKAISNEIFGYDYDDKESGETKHEEGLKAKLQDAFKDLERKYNTTSSELDALKENQEKAYDEFLRSRNEEAEALKMKVESLLPNALTAGLSSAYAEKRGYEEEERKSATLWFVFAVVAMVVAALCPIGTMVGRWLFSDLSFWDILMRSPRIVLAFLPLYAPLIWLAIVFNKRMNLAKRLIEEYSHKEALSKTFEGLATQIAAIDGDKGAAELRVQLLHNLIATSAENPGKLISGYNRSDNPIFEILEKSTALSNSLEKFASMPGVSFVLQAMERRRESRAEEAQTSVKEGVLVTEESLTKA